MKSIWLDKNYETAYLSNSRKPDMLKCRVIPESDIGVPSLNALDNRILNEAANMLAEYGYKLIVVKKGE